MRKRPAGNRGCAGITRLELPILSQADLADAGRCKPPGDPDTWFLDGWLQTAFKAFQTAIDAGGRSRIVVREGISCLYTRVMGQSHGGKVVSKQQMLEDRQSLSYARLANEIKALANIGIHMDRLARHVIEASTLAFRPDQMEEYINFNSQDETSLDVVMETHLDAINNVDSSAVVPAATNTMLSTFHTQLPRSY